MSGDAQRRRSARGRLVAGVVGRVGLIIVVGGGCLMGKAYAFSASLHVE